MELTLYFVLTLARDESSSVHDGDHRTRRLKVTELDHRESYHTLSSERSPRQIAVPLIVNENRQRATDHTSAESGKSRYLSRRFRSHRIWRTDSNRRSYYRG